VDVVLEQQSKNIAIVALGGYGIGGAEKRFTNFFMHNSDRDSFLNLFLILSREKHELLSAQFPDLIQFKNVIILNNISEKYKNSSIGKMHLKFKSLITCNKYIAWLFFPYLLAKYSIQLNRIVKRHKIDILHCFWEGITECAVVRAFNSRVAFILSYVEPVGRFLKNRFYRNNPSFLPWAIKKSDAVELQCKPYYTVLQKNNILPKSKNVFIAPCSFTDYSTSKIEKKENRVVFLARLDKYKNPILFLEAAKIALSKRDDISFELYGNGPLKNDIIQYLNKHKLRDKIAFGFTNDSFSVLAGSKIFCSLASFGSFPEQSTLEALSCENALITTVKEGDAGFYKSEFGITTTFSAEDLASKVEYLIDNPEVCSKLAKAGKEYAMQNHTIEKFSDYLTDVFFQVVKR
jgi:glycosyltransferase involved in cell wall biosynthesis